MKRMAVLVLILFLLTPALWTGAFLFHPKVKVGVVMVDDCEVHHGITAMNGFDNYEDFFEATMIPERFNASNVRIQDGDYLNSDFFKLGEPEKLQKKYGVDVILFVTDHPIRNWDEEGMGVWGQANSVTGSALMTVLHFNKGTHENRMVIEHIALHEVFHLLGYTHNRFDHSGIMQYGTNPFSRKLCPMYELQLPIRVCVYKLGLGMSFPIATLLTTSFFALVLVPMYAATELLIFNYFNTRRGVKKPTRVLIFLGILESFIVVIMVGAIIWLVIPVLIQFYFHLFVYFFSKKTKQKAKSAA